MAQTLKTDWVLFGTTVGMAAFGALMLYSASSVMAEEKFGSSWHFVVRQAIWVVPSLAAMMYLKRMDYRKLQNPAVAFTAIGVVIMLLGLVFFVDSTHHRWLRLGPVGLQPSELAKPALVIFLAYFVAWRVQAINTRYTLYPAALATGLVILAVVVADLGTAVVLGVTATVVFFVAGLRWRFCLIAGAIALMGLAVFIALKPYRMARIMGYIDPGNKILSRIDTSGHIQQYMHQSLTSRDTKYQAQQSMIAVGAGGVTGAGLMQGKQKLLYLPEAHTDFIYAVVGEEMGLAGSVAILVAFGLILWRGLRAAMRMPDDFGRYLALGITTVVVVQGLMNISVVLGMMPTKGIPLPLISSGGSSLLSTLASLGILMSVSEHAG
ncbi:MAG: putative peptidoglycan glycosyltransferase FtsW [Bryobacteraceae bacterium]|jgi:cell division protein FtsW